MFFGLFAKSITKTMGLYHGWIIELSSPWWNTSLARYLKSNVNFRLKWSISSMQRSSTQTNKEVQCTLHITRQKTCKCRHVPALMHCVQQYLNTIPLYLETRNFLTCIQHFIFFYVRNKNTLFSFYFSILIISPLLYLSHTLFYFSLKVSMVYMCTHKLFFS